MARWAVVSKGNYTEIYFKEKWAGHIIRYDKRNGCQPAQVSPEAIDLSIAAECKMFAERKPSRKRNKWWFVKSPHGTGGKGIDIRTTLEVKASLSCRDAKATPLLLSQYVTPVWTIRGRKWDVRVYLLIVSTNPLVAMWRPGYLQSSMEQFYIKSKDPAVHITNPHFSQGKTKDWGEFLWHFEQTLLEDLQRQSHPNAFAGLLRYKKLLGNMHSVILQWLYAVRKIWRRKPVWALEFSYVS